MTHPEIAHAHVTKISLLVKYREGAESEVLILSRQITFIHYCYCVVITTDSHCCFTYRLPFLRSVSAGWLDMVPAKSVHVTNSCL